MVVGEGRLTKVKMSTAAVPKATSCRLLCTNEEKSEVICLNWIWLTKFFLRLDLMWVSNWSASVDCVNRRNAVITHACFPWRRLKNSYYWYMKLLYMHLVYKDRSNFLILIEYIKVIAIVIIRNEYYDCLAIVILPATYRMLYLLIN